MMPLARMAVGAHKKQLRFLQGGGEPTDVLVERNLRERESYQERSKGLDLS